MSHKEEVRHFIDLIKKQINKVYLTPSKATSSLYFGKLFILITIDLEIPKLSKNEIVNKR